MNAINSTPVKAPDTYMTSDCYVYAEIDGKRHEFRRSGITAPFYPDHPCYTSETIDGVYVLDGGYLYPSRDWHAENFHVAQSNYTQSDYVGKEKKSRKK